MMNVYVNGWIVSNMAGMFSKKEKLLTTASVEATMMAIDKTNKMDYKI